MGWMLACCRLALHQTVHTVTAPLPMCRWEVSSLVVQSFLFLLFLAESVERKGLVTFLVLSHIVTATQCDPLIQELGHTLVTTQNSNMWYERWFMSLTLDIHSKRINETTQETRRHCAFESKHTSLPHGIAPLMKNWPVSTILRRPAIVSSNNSYFLIWHNLIQIMGPFYGQCVTVGHITATCVRQL